MKRSEEIYSLGRRFPENFFWESYRTIERVYRTPDGLFAVGTDDNIDYEVLWGVNGIDCLREGLNRVRRDYPRFIFRYAGDIETVVSKRELISQWSYDARATYIGYVLDLLDSNACAVSNPHVSRLTPEQFDEFLGLEESIFHFPNLTRDDLASTFHDADRSVWVLNLRNRIAGFVSVSQHAEHPECWVIRDLGVSKTLRHKGWGRKLLLHAVHQLGLKDANRILLWVDYDNLPARRLYEEVGFKINQNEAEAIFAAG